MKTMENEYTKAAEILKNGYNEKGEKVSKKKWLQDYSKFFDILFYGYINDDVRNKLKLYEKGEVSYNEMKIFIDIQANIEVEKLMTI